MKSKRIKNNINFTVENYLLSDLVGSSSSVITIITNPTRYFNNLNQMILFVKPYNIRS